MVTLVLTSSHAPLENRVGFQVACFLHALEEKKQGLPSGTSSPCIGGMGGVLLTKPVGEGGWRLIGFLPSLRGEHSFLQGEGEELSFPARRRGGAARFQGERKERYKERGASSSRLSPPAHALFLQLTPLKERAHVQAGSSRILLGAHVLAEGAAHLSFLLSPPPPLSAHAPGCCSRIQQRGGFRLACCSRLGA